MKSVYICMLMTMLMLILGVQNVQADPPAEGSLADCIDGLSFYLKLAFCGKGIECHFRPSLKPTNLLDCKQF